MKFDYNFSILNMILMLLLVALPSALALWFTSVISNSLFGTFTITPARWFNSFVIPVLFSYWGYKRKSLSLSGAISGLFVGWIITLSSYAFLACLIVFFVSSSKATKYKTHLKMKVEETFKEGGQRNWAQVLSNGIVASVVASVYLVDCGCSEQTLDFRNNFRCSWLSVAFLGAFACSNGDTWASELGLVLSQKTPWLITSLCTVPKGTNGAVSGMGILMSCLGGGVVSLGYLMALLIFVPSAAMQNSPPQWPILIIGLFAGLYGSLIDSFLGATLQFSGVNESGRIVEHPASDVKHISGIHLLDNHAVNLFSCLLTAITMPYITIHFYEMFT